MVRHFSDEYWTRYSRRGRVTAERHGEAAAEAHRRERARRRLAYLSSASAARPGRALEIGCGDGEALLELRQRGWSVLGIEPSHEKANNARGHGLDVRTELFEEVELEAGAFDLILHFHVLEHMADPQSALRRMRGLLSDHGRMLMETPTLYRPRTKPLEDFFRKAHFYVFTPATLEPMLALAGFRVLARDPDYAHLRWVCCADEPRGLAFDPGEARRAKSWCRWWNAAFTYGRWRRRLGLAASRAGCPDHLRGSAAGRVPVRGTTAAIRRAADGFSEPTGTRRAGVEARGSRTASMRVSGASRSSRPRRKRGLVA